MKFSKNTTVLFALLATGAMVLGGCATHRGGKHISVEPGVQMLMLDSAREADLDVTFNVPARYFSKRSRLYISPALYSGDSLVRKYEEVVLDAPVFVKKAERAAVLEGEEDPKYEVVRGQSESLHDSLSSGHSVAGRRRVR